ncbi:MAG: carboxypeptidase regulatory-like domain-containing protein [Polyangia bacterium]
MKRGRGLWAALLLVVLLLVPRGLWAIGEVTGRLGGVVTIDGTKDGLSGVPIVVRSKQLLGGSRTIETGDDGSYLFQSLPPGTYELEAKIEGFAPVEQRGIVVVAGQLAAVDVVLHVGQITETKKIIEKRNPILNPESAVSTTTLDNQKVSRTPVFRQVQSIAQLAAGVGPGTAPSVRGGLSRYTRFLVDGLDTSDVVTGGLSSPMNFDAVEQYNLFTGAMDAEYNSLGLVQNMVTRSGGNNFTLDASVVIQPTAFNLRTRYGAQLPQQNQALIYDDRDPPVRDFYSVNANVGGPIVKDRLWFFTSFQFNYNKAMTTVPPFPWLGITEDTDRFRDTYTYLGRAKLTWQVTTGTRVSLSFNIDRNYITNSAQQNTLAQEAERRVGRGGEWLVLLIDSALSPKWMFQMQAGFTDKRSVEDTMAVGPDGLPDRITPSHVLRTSDQFNGVTYLNSSLGWNEETKYRVQVDPTFLYSSMGLGGMHNVKFGAQFAYMSYRHNVGIAGGRNYVDTVPGTPCDPADPNTHASCSQVTEYPDSLPAADGSAAGGFSTTAEAFNIGFFAQDRYTIKRYLTLVPGFRFDVGVLRDYQGNKLGTMVGYGPRLSLVYDLLHDRSTLISAHYGRHNDVGNTYIADRGNPQQVAIQKNWDNASKSFVERNRSGGPGGQLFADNILPPSLDEVAAGIRREIITELIVGVDYTFRRYANMWANSEVNQVWDPAGTRIVGYVNGERRKIYQAETPDDAQRTYHGLDLWAQGNPGNWSLVASYTLAFTDGTVSDYFSAYRQNPRLNPLFYGPMSDNYRHTLKGAVDYSFDFGLNTSVRLQYRTGAAQWKVFQSPEDTSFSLYRSPRGTSTGTRVNDPTTWANFQLPDQFTVDLQFTYNFQKLTGQRIDLMLFFFNVLGAGIPTSIDARNGATFGTIQGRADNFNAEIIVRYRF